MRCGAEHQSHRETKRAIESGTEGEINLFGDGNAIRRCLAKFSNSSGIGRMVGVKENEVNLHTKHTRTHT